MTKLTCAVVRDLMPSYIEGLTSDETNALVDEHLTACAACRDELATLRASMEAPQVLSAEEHEEIDFLRRNRRRNGHIVLASALAALLTIALVLAARTFAIGSATPAGALAATVSVEGADLAIDLTPIDSASAVARASYAEQDGTVSVTTASVLVSPLHRGSLHATYRATTPIRQVRVNGRIVWSDGSEISALASEVFDTRHDYVGDMPANGRTMVALGAATYLGAWQNELQTDTEPYGWTLYLQQDVVALRQALMESDMRSYAYVMLGIIGNLDEVTFRYTVDGQEQELFVTTDDATAYLGQDIKHCGTNVRALDELLHKTGLVTPTGA